MSSNPHDLPSFSPDGRRSKARRIRWWVAGVVIVVVILVSGVAAYFYTQSISTPQKTLTALCNAWMAGDYKSVEALHANYMNLQQMEWIDSNIGAKAKECAMNKVQVHGSTATATLTLTFVDGETTTGPVYLRLENGTWKVEVL